MYEVAHVAGNKVEAACALQSLSNIMGQITSSNHHHHNSNSSGGKATNNSKIYPRHSMSAATTAAASVAAAAARKDDQLYRDHLKDMYKIRESIRHKDSSSNVISNGRMADRPVTISEMNAYNVEKSEAVKNVPSSVAVPSAKVKNNKEFYTVGEGYHKTENCYYKTPDGGFHKLPPDSFHKMSEICYTKLADGSFRRLDDLQNTTTNGGATTGDSATTNGSHHKVRNQMIKFLKRSKSHTPATIKELQKSKDEKRERLNAAAAAMERHNNSGNRKVVVTMMENGGLPIVATSKPASKREPINRDKSHSSHNKDYNRNVAKVGFFFYFYIFCYVHIFYQIKKKKRRSDEEIRNARAMVHL